MNVCDSQSFAPQQQPVYQNPGEGHRLMTTSWNGRVSKLLEEVGTSEDSTCFLDSTRKNEVTMFGIPHIEQQGTQSYTTGGAVHTAVQKRHTERTESEVDELGQEKHKRDG